MSGKEIEKKIKWYTICKFLILGVLITFETSLVINIFFINNKFFEIILYFAMILTVIVAYTFPINIPLSRNHSVKDFPGILEYLANIPENIGKQRYFEGLVMIKNSLDDIVHYHMEYGMDEDIRACICYLQGKFHSEKNCIIPMQLYDRSYVCALCQKLQEEVNDVKFNAEDLDNIIGKGNQVVKRKKRITIHNIYNIVIICFLIFKIVVSVNNNLYDSMDNNIFERLFYNVGVEVLTIALRVLSYLRSVLKQRV